MEDIIKSIKAFLYDRSSSPLFGALALSWSIWNFKFWLIAFSSSSWADKNRHLDEHFYESVCLIFFQAPAWMINSVLMPVLLASFYLFAYPFLAAPVYRFVLAKRNEIKDIKIRAQNEEPISKAEAYELRIRISDMESLHRTEIEEKQALIDALKNKYEGMEGDGGNEGKGVGERADFSGILAGLDEETFPDKFVLEDVVGGSDWVSLSSSDRKAIGKLFRRKVERGDYVSIRFSGRDSQNRAIYTKVSDDTQSDDGGLHDLDIESAQLMTVLEMFKDSDPVNVSDVQERLDISKSAARYIFDRLSDAGYCSYAGDGMFGHMYGITSRGRSFMKELGIFD